MFTIRRDISFLPSCGYFLISLRLHCKRDAHGNNRPIAGKFPKLAGGLCFQKLPDSLENLVVYLCLGFAHLFERCFS
jgi:hypothetical protein